MSREEMNKKDFEKHNKILVLAEERNVSAPCFTSVGHFLRTVHTCYPFLFSAPAFALV